ncbi:hypothetical protein BUE80_DR001654 [Diplocarpon rosae]|nr:hypothetical protein BUE80_DR001654 [Diplocarpon rosae]
MSSGFISGGTADAPLERGDEWLAAQREIEANALRRAELARQADGKSLFETLEANKAAKQEAFEEAHRLKNQFRGVDEDEAEWLDSVLESTRAEEDRIRKETSEGLALFRQQQEAEDKKARQAQGDSAGTEENAPLVEEGSWATGKKRKRTKEKDGLKGVKLRRASTSVEKTDQLKTPKPSVQAQTPRKPVEGGLVTGDTKKVSSAPKPATSLVSYGSDDDDW